MFNRFACMGRESDRSPADRAAGLFLAGRAHKKWSKRSLACDPGPTLADLSSQGATKKLAVPTGGPAHSSTPGFDQHLEFLESSQSANFPGFLGRYEILEFIGRGAMGIVLKAIDPVLQRMVAIKVLDSKLLANPACKGHFLREARAAAAIASEHVVAIHTAEEFKGRPYLVMQYVPGRNLEQRLEKGPLELGEIIRIARQTAAGLACAHAKGLIHRDIKPSNIMLEEDHDCVKIVDFGLVLNVNEARVEQHGALFGTPHYMSPEQFNGEAVDQRSDLYSLGVMMYRMVTGREPFQGETVKSLMAQHLFSLPPSFADVAAPLIVSNWLEQLVVRLLRKNPDARPQTAKEVIQCLGVSGLDDGRAADSWP
jgi:serine/threonine protein kinase